MHEWNCGCCDHEPLTGPPTSPDGKELEYFSRYEPAFKALQKLIMDKQWLKSMKYYVKFRSVANSSVIVVLCMVKNTCMGPVYIVMFVNTFLYII